LDRPKLPGLPSALEDHWGRLAERHAAFDERIAQLDSAAAEAMRRVAICSDFVASVLAREPESLLARVAEAQPLTAEILDTRLALGECRDEAEAMAVLRRVRRLEMARIAWRDLAGWAELEQSLAELSLFADCAIRAALEFAGRTLEPRHGRAVDTDGEQAPLLVLGMGKLGGGELNFSSDIDLVLLFPDAAAVDGPSGIDAEEYYRKLAQLLIRLLDQRTPDGSVFRVDTRLRPFGASGPLVVSTAAFEAYLERHGRDWERYAYVKARLITGRPYEAELFREILTPFVYRRYLDFGVFDALREMKALISKEVARRDMLQNIKLGPGGIREIEFIAQAFQLVRGGRDPRLQQRSLLAALPMLVDGAQLDAETAATLERAYRFLRILENRLQEVDDRQTHDLPDDALSQARLSYAMGCADWQQLLDRTDEHRNRVERLFRQIAIESSRGVERAAVAGDWESAWQSGDFDDVLETLLPAERAAFASALIGLRESSLYRRMDEPSRRRLTATLAHITTMLATSADAADVLRRTLPVLQAIGRRSAYLALLNENPAALERLLTLARQSEFLARQVSNHPMLLDELLDARVFETPPSRSELEQTLAHYLARSDAGDIEARLDALRQFQRTAVFRIAVADRFGRLPLMKVSDRLTDIAEIVLAFALDMAYREFAAKHGKPMCDDDGRRREAGFAIVAYGKLGGFELGYGSDLDIVFLHDSNGARQETDGEATIDNGRFFARLAQRLIHYLTIQTSSGKLYEVDTRLRPSGQSGLLVTSMEAFGRYQRERAWVWEHQALLRSRSVAGDSRVCTAFERERREILINHVDRSKLKTEVRRMREKMRAELAESKAGQFDLKQDPGGLADIEFFVDYCVLGDAKRYPELIEFPDNIRQLEALERTGLLPAQRCTRLRDIYLRLRERVHELALAARGRIVDDREFASDRAWVRELWDATFVD
jgi:glutamate-ammonia-ligase adenylyltransferase